MPRRLSAVLIATLMLGVGPSSAFNVSGFEFHDVDRRLGERPADAGRAVDYESVVTSYNNARDAVINTQSSSSVMERLSRQLTAEARALFERIPPERRTSYDQAMAAALESYTQMRATNQELVGRLARVSAELRALQSQILQTEGGELRLRSEIAALHETAEELHAEQRRIAAELPDVLACEEFARNLSRTLDRDLAAIRNEYWTEIGRYFKDRNFGTPVDYASPLQALPAQTERRSEVRDERYSTLTTPAAVLSSSPMVAAAVITDWGQAFPVAVATSPRSSGTTSGTEEEFSNRLAMWDQALQEHNRLSAAAGTAMIESEEARYQLKAHIAAQSAADRDRSVVTDEVERLRTEVGFKAWELEQRTSEARDWLGECVDKAVEIGRWKALKNILALSLANPVTARSMYAHLHLAAKVGDDLMLAPDIITNSDNPVMQAEARRLKSADSKYGRDFVRRLWDAKTPTQPLRRVFEKLLGPKELQED